MMFCTIGIIHNECTCFIMLVQHTSTNENDEDYTIPLSTSYDAVQYSPAHYQPLDTVTTDYTSMYTTPTGKREPCTFSGGGGQDVLYSGPYQESD